MALIVQDLRAKSDPYGQPGFVPAGTLFILVCNVLAVFTLLVLLLRFSLGEQRLDALGRQFCIRA